MARINKAVSTNERSKKFFAEGLDSEIEKLPDGQISRPAAPHLCAFRTWPTELTISIIGSKAAIPAVKPRCPLVTLPV
jgi:hypothetical protein